MAERRTRRSFTREFKAQAVKRLLEGGKGLSEVATEPGLSTGQLSTWRGERLAAGSAEAPAARKAEEAEVQRLKRGNRRLEEENLILREAAAVFARGIA
jgi:transposase